MPIKDPDSWGFIVSPELRAALMSVVIAWLRIAYDDKVTKWRRMAIETALCGALSFGIGSGLSYFDGLPPGVAVFAGTLVGLFGIDFVRTQGRKYFKEKSRSGKNE